LIVFQVSVTFLVFSSDSEHYPMPQLYNVSFMA
jgi:hypothetical protein